MIEWLEKLLRRNDLGPSIKLFGICHFAFVFAIFVFIFLIYLLYKNKTRDKKQKVVNIIAIVLVLLYILDFFLQPLYTGNNTMDIYKLPFHLCTFMAVLIGLNKSFNNKFKFLDNCTVTLSIFASLSYLIIPGTALNGSGMFSYVVTQTFVYHGILLAYGILSLLFGLVSLDIKKIYIEVLVLLFVLLWAALGNYVYGWGKYDWFFITGLTFPNINKVLLPILVYMVCVSGCSFIYGMYYLILWLKKRNISKNN